LPSSWQTMARKLRAGGGCNGGGALAKVEMQKIGGQRERVLGTEACAGELSCECTQATLKKYIYFLKQFFLGVTARVPLELFVVCVGARAEVKNPI